MCHARISFNDMSEKTRLNENSRERLEREYDLDLITTAPSVVYKVEKGEGDKKTTEIIDTPSKMPEIMRDMTVTEPYVRMEILTPSDYNGAIIELGQERRGILKDIKYLTPTRSVFRHICGISDVIILNVFCRSTIVYELPLAEVITDFFDQLKSRYG